MRRTWDEFCTALRDAGELVFRDGAPNNPVDQAVGLRYITRNIPLALAFALENRDPTHPELMRYFDPTRKQGGDNGDAIYLGAPINGTDNYLLSGDRGTASYLAITVVEEGDTPWGGAATATLMDKDLQCGEDGEFEIYLGPKRPPAVRNYLPTTPRSIRFTVRQFFADWEEERPMNARINRLAHFSPPPPLSPAALADGLQEAARWLQWSTSYWADILDRWRARPNEFLHWAEVEKLPIDATPGGTPLICYWSLPADEVLLLRVTPPQCRYWNCEFGSYWFETMDYRYRLAGLNGHQALLEEDGSLLVVVSHDDPGVPNWLDTSGHSAGYITFRWMDSAERPRPVCTQLKRKNLAAALPPGVRTVSPAYRHAQVVQRRWGVCNRFRV